MRPMRTVALASSIAGAMLLATCGAPRPKAIAVDIRQMAFWPADVRARIGDTLVFTNHDFVPHTATARDRSWDSGSIAPDASWRGAVTAAGGFYCTFHPTMTGKITTE
ncbi:MAG TPA: hypothetical protein VF021_04390 [Longimicrobiales bacterium]